MNFLNPQTPPYGPQEWRQANLEERARLCTEAWATQGYGTPFSAYLFYVLKALGYVWVWTLWCSLSPELGGWETVSQWWLHPLALEKAIAWSMLFEVLGFGCGSGPLTGRYLPPFGGVLYFSRPGTLKAPLFPGRPLIGRAERGVLDVVVYLGLVLALLGALMSPSHHAPLLWAVAILVPLLGLLDRSAFLATRPEHYWVMTLGFALGEDGLAVALWMQLALWFWAGVSKLNPHFPTVVGVMVSNSPALALPWIRKRMYRNYPEDLRPSALANTLSHFGTGLELGIPLVMLMGYFYPPLFVVGLVMVVMLHTYIISNVPMGVPNEWNLAVAYGAFVIFSPHTVRVDWQIESIAALGVVIITGFLLPLYGNLRPERLSFLLAMRYYAGNWPYSIWLFKGEAHRKLRRIKGSSKWLDDQLGVLYDEAVIEGVKSRIMAFRLMHLQGRLLPSVLRDALPDIRDYTYMEGEVIAGMTLGWNFGDGHLHHESLLESIQKRVDFAPSELCVVMVEPQALGDSEITFRVVDAALGELRRGRVSVAALQAIKPSEFLPDGAITLE